MLSSTPWSHAYHCKKKNKIPQTKHNIYIYTHTQAKLKANQSFDQISPSSAQPIQWWRRQGHCTLTPVQDVWVFFPPVLGQMFQMLNVWVTGTVKWLLGWGPLERERSWLAGGGKERGNLDSEWVRREGDLGWVGKGKDAWSRVINFVWGNPLFTVLYHFLLLKYWFWFKAKIRQSFETCLQR